MGIRVVEIAECCERMHCLHSPHPERLIHCEAAPVPEVIRNDSRIERKGGIIPEGPTSAAMSTTSKDNAGKLIGGYGRSCIDGRINIAWLDCNRVEDIGHKQSFPIGDGVDVGTERTVNASVWIRIIEKPLLYLIHPIWRSRIVLRIVNDGRNNCDSS